MEKLEDLQKKMRIEPAFDRRDSNPSKNYGIHGMSLYMALVGKKGAVSLTIYLNIQLPHVHKEMIIKNAHDPYALSLMFAPMAVDIGWHSPVPLFDWQKEYPPREGCDLLGGGVCHGDGSTLNAEPYLHLLATEGSEAVWPELAIYYNSVFYDIESNDSKLKDIDYIEDGWVLCSTPTFTVRDFTDTEDATEDDKMKYPKAG
jgi:hypothetical protein